MEESINLISIGVDASLTGTGIVVLENGVVSLVKTISTNNKIPTIGRVAYIIKNIADVTDLFPIEKKVIISIEGFSFGSKGRSVFEIGYLGWRIRESFIENDFKWIDVPPSNLKKYATGKGNCAKELILQQVYKRWGQEFNDNNQADAYVLAKIGQSYVHGDKGLTEFQISSMDAVRKVNSD